MTSKKENPVGAFLDRIAPTTPEFGGETLFRGTTYDELVAFLALGKVNVETFDQEGLKSLEELFEECRGRDITLTRDMDGTIYRHAKSSKIQIIVPSEGICYQETARKFLRKNLKVSHNPPKWEGVSETAKHNESPLQAAMTGLMEELGSGISIDGLVMLPREEQPEPSVSASSVYPGIISKTHVTRFRLTLSERLWKGKKKIIKDGNIQVHIEEFPYSEY